MLLMILTKINKSCHESCHEITEPLIFQGFWNLVLWVQVPSPALIRKSRKHAIFIEKSKVYGFFFLMTASTAATLVSATSAI